MNEMHLDSIIRRIRTTPSPSMVWINAKDVLCCGPEYPEELDTIIPVGTYVPAGFSEMQFREDVRYASQLT